MPNRVAAPTTNASCVATVICPEGRGSAAERLGDQDVHPKLAMTKTPRPITFWPVPARIVRRSREPSPPVATASLSRFEERMSAKYGRPDASSNAILV